MLVIDVGAMIWQEIRDRPWLYGDVEFVWPYRLEIDCIRIEKAVVSELRKPFSWADVTLGQ